MAKPENYEQNTLLFNGPLAAARRKKLRTAEEVEQLVLWAYKVGIATEKRAHITSLDAALNEVEEESRKAHALAERLANN